MILEMNNYGPIGTNAFVLACEKTRKGAIIDAPPGSGEALIARAKELNINIEMLLLTHSHWDHIGDMAFLKKTLQVPLYIHELDAPNLRNPGADGLPTMMAIEGIEPDRFLLDGETLHLGELELEVIHTPGHSPGGVCFYLEKEETLISGDTLFCGSIGNLSLPTAEAEKMWPSLEKLAKLPPDVRVYPGHGEETTIGRENWLPRAKEYFGG